MKNWLVWQDRWIIGLVLVIIVGGFLLSGCTTKQTNVISTNNFRQKNYDMQCLDGTKTFSQIIVCLQATIDKEHAQNNITNDLIDNNK